VAFFEIVHAGFAHKRKTLRNNLTMAGFSTEAIDALWQTQGFSEKIRPEDITIDEWFLIAQAIHGDKNESAVY
jgi:16S rRNA A1518/A1519 N6-dimethyltransferase RsmA/KsgA/DIM1 with predicted DNA glycosylase/AP lyase activity